MIFLGNHLGLHIRIYQKFKRKIANYCNALCKSMASGIIQKNGGTLHYEVNHFQIGILILSLNRYSTIILNIYKYHQAQYINPNCSGIRKTKIHLGIPADAFWLESI